ncbi:hypothetical protein [Prochlorococcus marinus]|uniref:hypothetical protein n=1 Tax=Prochlorococcus marinus TaxID=1219 RepID=UPI0012FF21E0|nr:hypothetical protein [Prochlorococcus marinus]
MATFRQPESGLATSNQWQNRRDHERVALAGDVVLSYLLSCLTTTAHFFEVHFEGLVQQGLCFHRCDPFALLVVLLVLSLLVLKESLLRHQVSQHPSSRGLFDLYFFSSARQRPRGSQSAGTVNKAIAADKPVSTTKTMINPTTIWQQQQGMKKGTRVGCPQVQDRFSGFLRPRTPDLGLSKQQQGVSRKNYSFRSSVSKRPRTTLSHLSGAGSHKHFLLLRTQKRTARIWMGD